MPLRKLHFAIGIAGIVAFLATGALLNPGLPDLFAMDEVLRYVARSNHVYVLLASLSNVAVGVHLSPGAPGWRSTVSKLGSLLALAAPAVLCLAFFLEATRVSAERVVTLLGVSMLAAGIALHVLGGARRYDVD